MNATDSSYYERVVDLLRADHRVRSLAFRGQDINWYGKGDNHRDVMVIQKPGWLIDCAIPPYAGVNAHFESRGPGDFRLDVELGPRQQSAAKGDQEALAPLHDLRVEITEALRSVLLSPDFGLQEFGVSTRGSRRNIRDPKSLMAVVFDVGLHGGHSPEQFVEATRPIMEMATPIIDEVMLAPGSR